MSCDQYFERCLQNKFDANFRSPGNAETHEKISSAPHRLLGTEIWLDAGGREEVFLEGVTGIQLLDGKILFQTVLGETLSLKGEVDRVTLREGSIVLQTK